MKTLKDTFSQLIYAIESDAFSIITCQDSVAGRHSVYELSIYFHSSWLAIVASEKAIENMNNLKYKMDFLTWV